jgi:hypothetical protein
VIFITCWLCSNEADSGVGIGADPFCVYVPVCSDCAARPDVVDELQADARWL